MTILRPVSELLLKEINHLIRYHPIDPTPDSKPSPDFNDIKGELLIFETKACTTSVLAQDCMLWTHLLFGKDQSSLIEKLFCMQKGPEGLLSLLSNYK